jgi:hypothetical protein
LPNHLAKFGEQVALQGCCHPWVEAQDKIYKTYLAQPSASKFGAYSLVLIGTTVPIKQGHKLGVVHAARLHPEVLAMNRFDGDHGFVYFVLAQLFHFVGFLLMRQIPPALGQSQT